MKLTVGNTKEKLNMKVLIAFVFILSVLSCKKQDGSPAKPADIVPGGKGGNMNLAIFPVFGTKGVKGKVLIKYGSKSIPSKYSDYDDSSATMVEPVLAPMHISLD